MKNGIAYLRKNYLITLEKEKATKSSTRFWKTFGRGMTSTLVIALGFMWIVGTPGPTGVYKYLFGILGLLWAPQIVFFLGIVDVMRYKKQLLAKGIDRAS